jgi:hypothetical protein
MPSVASALGIACGLRLALNGFILPQKAIRVIQRLPRVTIAGASHEVNIEQNSAFNQAMFDFWE